MSNVTQLIIEPPLLKVARNQTLAIVNLSNKQNLTLAQAQETIHAMGMLAREAHDYIVDAEFEQQDKTQGRG
ncbi:hypothetical protein Q3V30_12875 [Erwinia pyri]|uniref:Uncharacterized protein n=1 Tax=Erwinia pyri TaxID=3062598 RepID=A0AA50HNZ9_9GAMM|nr:hypothetical protein [Erwinia sp. DE2]WLS77378.1 hypothetical protein Q3V30_12875 [Erwinia sp. DE2]